MPRKTKEPKKVDDNEEMKNKAVIKETDTTKKEPTLNKKSASKTVTKKSTSSADKKSTSSKKSNTEKKSSSTKKSTTTKKEASTKKTSTSSKSKTSKKVSSAKKTPTKKASTKKTSTSKKTLAKEKLDFVEYYDLPYRYNQTVVKILAQTPNTLFVYWDISDSDRENFKKQYGDNFFEKTRPILIITNSTMQYSFEIEINDFANSWYLQVKDTNCNYHIELGRRPIPEYTKNEVLPNYFYITTSNSITSPNDHVLFTQNEITFKNVKNNTYTHKSISSLKIRKGIQKIYNIFDIYKELYKDEEVLYDLSNPSSGNPTSGNFRIGKFN